MYSFPPTAWELYGLSWTDTSYGWAFILVVVIVLCFQTQRSTVACAVWSFAVTTFFLACGITASMLASPFRPVFPADVVLLSILTATCGIGAIRTTWALTKAGTQTARPVIIGVSASFLIVGLQVLMPSLSHPVASARSQCRSNLRQIGFAMHTYHDVHHYFPLAHPDAKKSSWRITLLPYLDRQELFDRYQHGSAWNSPENSVLAQEAVRPYDCPQRLRKRNRNVAGEFLTAYVVPTGPDSIFDGRGRTGLNDIPDGTGQTVLAMEACGTDIVWTQPHDRQISDPPMAINSGSGELDRSPGMLSSYHPGGAQFLLADGSVRFLNEAVDPVILKALLTKSAGDDPGDDW